jgi:hypothetical protein
MKRSALTLLAVLLLGGCAEPLRNTADEASPVDAERLLASTLENAAADNKRVIVHLGAPW